MTEKACPLVTMICKVNAFRWKNKPHFPPYLLEFRLKFKSFKTINIDTGTIFFSNFFHYTAPIKTKSIKTTHLCFSSFNLGISLKSTIIETNLSRDPESRKKVSLAVASFNHWWMIGIWVCLFFVSAVFDFELYFSIELKALPAWINSNLTRVAEI